MTSERHTHDTRAPYRKKRWLVALKLVAVAAVVAALAGHVRELAHDWSTGGMSWGRVVSRPGWLLTSLVLFLAAQIVFSIWWGRLLRGVGVVCGRLPTLRAYAVGTLGKYVPGKIGVVLLRSGLLPGADGARLTVGLATVYETVATMAVGAALAGVCVLIAAPEQWLLGAGAWALALLLGVGLHPAVFGRLGRVVALPFKKAPDAFLARACHAALGRWFLLPAVGWVLAGGSLFAVMRAAGLPCDSIGDLAIVTGAAALATVVGFLALFLPAGIGLRELVLIHLLTPRFDATGVVLAALLLRTVWTVGEVLLGGVLYAAVSTRNRTGKESASPVDGPGAIGADPATRDRADEDPVYERTARRPRLEDSRT